ncbi:MAG TPA: RNA polymerase sigma factor [Cellvibrio sp.]|nr:RNA polymerase sigma factor [Cellvibrio sp.]
MQPTLTCQKIIADIYSRESRRVLATLIRLLGDFDLAEEALHEAFAAALAQWPGEGIPANPRAWLVSAGRFKAIDQLRRRARFNTSLLHIAEGLEEAITDSEEWGEDSVEDDQLRLIFTCCHPGLSPEAQLALTLREVCGLTTEAIARAFLVSPSTIAQRIVRSKAKIRDAAIPYEVPTREQLPERLDALLQVIYLLFNEGYSASSGEALTRQPLSREAIRLGRLLRELMPQTEVLGLLALMLLQDARSAARSDDQGELITLENQDRSLWNHSQIAEGSEIIQQALRQNHIGSYSLQAAIAVVHATAAHYSDTDWNEILSLYDLLLRLHPSPVVELNRAVAVAMRDGAAMGLKQVLSILQRGDLSDYYLAHAACADFHARLGQIAEAKAAYEKALSLTQQEPEQRFLRNKIAQL